MKNQILLSLCVSALLGTAPTLAVTPKRADFNDYVQGVSHRAHNLSEQWRNSQRPSYTKGPQRVVEQMGEAVGPVSYWGSVYTTDDQEMMYTIVYHEEPITEYSTTITGADITIYDADFNVFKSFSAEFSLGENETSINTVQVAPRLTKKFFNINDDYEVMLYVHATTVDYAGHSYTQVYTLADNSLVTTLEGDNVGGINLSEDPWSEKYTLMFMRENVEITEDAYNYTILFDIYGRAGWGGSCTLEHTFEIDYSLISGAGNYALPILMNSHKGEIYYALPHYEKPYFVSDWSEDITPDNNFIIDLYNSKYELVKTTTIPMILEDGALFSFPGLGELYGNDDMMFDKFDETGLPNYMVGVENYKASTDDFVTSFYRYDSDGNLMRTLVQDADDYIRMSDLPGYESQFCFLYLQDDTSYFKFIDMPSGYEAATIPVAIDDVTISTSIDRCLDGREYMYVSSLLVADVDAKGNAIHKLAWFDKNGKFVKYDKINLGKNIAMAQVYIAEEALSPYLFDTDNGREYMFLVKEYAGEEGSVSKSYLRIYGDDSSLLLNVGPNEEEGEYLNTIFLFDPKGAKPKLMIGCNTEDAYNLHHIDLPLTKFAGGEGTAANPYLIQSPGDLMAVQENPSAHYKQVSDIDFGSYRWNGNKCVFTGSYDGDGHALSNIYLCGNSIFGSVGGKAEISNITIDDITLEAEGVSGIIANSLSGSDDGSPIVSNVIINDAMVRGSGEISFGGIAGEAMLYSTITDCAVNHSSYLLNESATVGGIAGNISTSSKIQNSVMDGWIVGGVCGGIVGSSSTGDETIENCHANVSINAFEVAGGIIGYSSRSFINHCYVDGEIFAVGTGDAFAGGIAGQINSTYADERPIIIKDCIVAAQIEANDFAEKAIAHRIAGFTSGDEMLVDWDSKDPNVNWEDPSTYPYVPGEKETSLSNNYALNIPIIDSTVEDFGSSTEGKSITSADLTDEFLAEHAWDMDTWKRGGSALVLKSESLEIVADPISITLSESEPAYVIFTCASRYAKYIDVKSSDETVATVGNITASDDGSAIICEVRFVGTGTCSIEATLGDESASCSVVTQTTIISTVVDSSKIAVKGRTLVSEGENITVYNLAGMKVAIGINQVDLTHLPKGTYIAVAANEVLKFAL